MSSESDHAECPKCGKTFKNNLGVSSHYGQVHEGSIAGVTITCAYCGKEKEKRQKKKRNNNEFCSRECYGKWRSENLSGEDSAAWEGRQITVECDYCGGYVEKHAVNVEKTENNFCDQDCLSKWKSENLTGDKTHNWKGEELEVDCFICGETHRKSKQKLERNKRNFCSIECRGIWQSRERRGENHPRWIKDNDTISYGGTWPEARRERLERDGYECVVCGKSDGEEREQTGAGLDVHHIVKARKFLREDGTLDEQSAHRIENLVSLCSKCHNRWEGIPLRPETN